MAKKYELGPKLWYKIHRKAIKAKGRKKKVKKYVKFIFKIYHSIKCEDCKGHLRKFMGENPLHMYCDSKDGLFIWSWKLHNDVNQRIDKNIIDYDRAKALYK